MEFSSQSRRERRLHFLFRSLDAGSTTPSPIPWRRRRSRDEYVGPAQGQLGTVAGLAMQVPGLQRSPQEGSPQPLDGGPRAAQRYYSLLNRLLNDGDND